MGKKKKNKQKKPNLMFGCGCNINKAANIQYKNYSALSGLAVGPVDDGTYRPPMRVSLTANPVYATVLEGASEGYGEAALVVPVPKTKAKKAIKRTDVYKELSDMFTGMGDFLSTTIEWFNTGDTAERIPVVILEGLDIGAASGSRATDSEGRTTKTLTIVFVGIPDALLVGAFDDNKKFIPEDYTSEDYKDEELNSNAEIVISLLADITACLRKKVMTLMISPKDRIYDADGGADNKSFASYIAAIRKVSKTLTFQYHIRQVYINVPTEAMYMALCRR